MRRLVSVVSFVAFVAVVNANAGTLTIQAGPGGVIRVHPSFTECRNTCTWTQPTGHVLRFSYVADKYFAFAGWTGACSGTAATCEVTVTDNTVFGARFKDIGPASATLSLSVSGAGTAGGPGGSGIYCTQKTCSTVHRVGETFVLTASPASSAYRFAGWSGACSGTGTCTITLQGDTSVQASFMSKPITE